MSARARKLLRWLLVSIAVLVIGALLSLRYVVQPYVRQKVQAMVQEHLRARLEFGSMRYRFPYGVSVRDASFISEASDASGASVQLLTVERLDLSLAELPFGGGPIVVERLSVQHPVIHLLRMPDGKLIVPQVVQKEAVTELSHRLKLSDIFRLREVSIVGAELAYDNRARPDSKPMAWRDVSAHVSLSPASASHYQIHFTAENPPIAKLSIDATADIDTLSAAFQKIAMSVSVRAADDSSPLPARLQQIVHTLGIEGSVQIAADGSIGFENPTEAGFNVDVKLDRVRAQPKSGSSELRGLELNELSGSIHAARKVGEKQISVQLADLSISGVGANLRSQPISASLDTAAKTWQVGTISASIAATQPGQIFSSGKMDITGSASGSFAAGQPRVPRGQIQATLDHVSVQPPGFPQPLRDIVGILRIQDQTLLAQNITAKYNDDQLSLNQAIVALAQMPARIEARNLLGTVTMAGNTDPAKYPRWLDDIIVATQPSGVFELQGAVAMYRRRDKYEPDFAISVFPKNSAATISKHHVPVTNMAGEVAITPKLVTLRELSGAALDGTLTVSGNVTSHAPMTFNGDLRARGADIGQLAKHVQFLKADGQPKITGKLSTHVALAGEFPADATTRPIEQLRGRGWVRVNDGDFWSLNVLDGIVSNVPVARDALTAGHAAASFEFGEQRIHFKQVAISSPALGITGSGDATYAGELALDFVVAPLGDWRNKIKSTGIPILSDVAGNLVGELQKLVNTATSNLLYQFRVTGNRSAPKVEAIPAPLLTEGAANLFGMMLRNTGADKLFDGITGESTEKAPTTQPTSSSRD